MSIILDIIAATIIGGIMLISIFSMMGNINQANFEKTLSTNVQGNIITLARIMESDILKIGYHTKTDAIQSADSTNIAFKSDLTNSGTVVSVQYSLGDTVSSTRNANDRMLIRQATGQQTINANVGMTYLRFAYFDTLGRELQYPLNTKARLDSIKAIRIKIRLESSEPVYSSLSNIAAYQNVYWEKTIYPKNLNQ